MRQVALAWGWVVVGVLSGACRGTHSHEVGSGGDSGVAAAEAPKAREIPFKDSGCDALGLQYASREDTGACPTLDCACPNTFPTLPLQGPRGCVVALDCAAACTPEGGAQAYLCALAECEDDAQCNGRRCFIPPGHDVGHCGDPGYDCVETADCNSGDVCVADNEGARRCTLPAEFSPCNDDEQCAGMRCIHEGTYFVGACSSRHVGSPCATSFDCEKGLSCPNRECTDGLYQSPCAQDSDCTTKQCRQGSCAEGRPNDYCDTDEDCQSSICVHGVICTTGELDEPCADNDDCLSGICAGDNRDSACTDGQAGSKCLTDEDCLSSGCRYDVELRPGDHFGRCD